MLRQEKQNRAGFFVYRFLIRLLYKLFSNNYHSLYLYAHVVIGSTQSFNEALI